MIHASGTRMEVLHAAAREPAGFGSAGKHTHRLRRTPHHGAGCRTIRPELYQDAIELHPVRAAIRKFSSGRDRPGLIRQVVELPIPADEMR